MCLVVRGILWPGGLPLRAGLTSILVWKLHADLYHLIVWAHMVAAMHMCSGLYPFPLLRRCSLQVAASCQHVQCAIPEAACLAASL
jgi:hypothetical protein